jgi:hypothetical protein
VGPLSSRHPQLAERERPQILRTAANILNKQSLTAEKEWSSAWGLGDGLTTPHHKNSMFRSVTQRIGAGSSEHGNEPSGYIKDGEFLD